MSLAKLRDKVFNKQGGNLATAFFYLARELGCLSDLIGRNYEGEISFGKLKMSFQFRQKPMTFAQLNTLLKELNLHNKREEKQARKVKKR